MICQGRTQAVARMCCPASASAEISVCVAMMNVREVRVLVGQDCMFMQMLVRLDTIPKKVVLMLVMHIVNMPMRVFDRLMRV